MNSYITHHKLRKMESQRSDFPQLTHNMLSSSNCSMGDSVLINVASISILGGFHKISLRRQRCLCDAKGALYVDIFMPCKVKSGKIKTRLSDLITNTQIMFYKPRFSRSQTSVFTTSFAFESAMCVCAQTNHYFDGNKRNAAR